MERERGREGWRERERREGWREREGGRDGEREREGGMERERERERETGQRDKKTVRERKGVEKEGEKSGWGGGVSHR